MPERYVDAILKHLSGRSYQPLKPRQLARQMGVAESEYGSFREAVKQLRDQGRVVLGARNAVTLPEMSSRVVGTFRLNPRGFGFVIPETPNAHGDLFVPKEDTGGALTGDLVVARTRKRGKRGGETAYSGVIVEIVERGTNRFVGALEQAEGTWFVIPDGTSMTVPIVIRDVGEAGPPVGSKVVVEIVEYPKPGELPAGVIVERLGAGGEAAVETLSVIRAHSLPDEFSEAALREARRAVDTFSPAKVRGREDLSGETILTIDPPDARDYDDAISLQENDDGTVTLGVHIADVSHFVPDGGALDTDARKRGTSVYFPRRVLPMLPEVLSNGVCSLQEGQPRLAKSAMITYDEDGEVVSSRLAETVIRSAKRLTYVEAQEIIDGRRTDADPDVAGLLRDLHGLARRIEQRRRDAGMLHLDLPAVELLFDEQDRVVGAEPEDDSYTHTMIEMFMVEANEAVARTLDAAGRRFLRRIHPEPDPTAEQGLRTFVRACGHRLPRGLSRKAIQDLLESVRGKPESYAVNLAILKTFQQAEYSPLRVGHFALASNCYCHFTSPIRRYPDLTVHRLMAAYCRGELDELPPDDMSELTELGERCSAAARRAETAEREVRDVLMLLYLEDKIGDVHDGVITGVTNFGVFVQLEELLVEGLVRMEDLGDDWWELDPRTGQLRGERTGRKHRIGDRIRVRIVNVDVARRQMNLVPEAGKARKDEPNGGKRPKGAKRAKSMAGGGKGSKGAKKATSAGGKGGERSKGKKDARRPAREGGKGAKVPAGARDKADRSQKQQEQAPARSKSSKGKAGKKRSARAGKKQATPSAGSAKAGKKQSTGGEPKSAKNAKRAGGKSKSGKGATRSSGKGKGGQNGGKAKPAKKAQKSSAGESKGPRKAKKSSSRGSGKESSSSQGRSSSGKGGSGKGRSGGRRKR